MNLIKMKTGIFKVLPIFLLLSACTLSNDAEIEFPNSEQNLMLECYLTPGSNFELSLMETNGFKDDLVLQLVWNADILISTEEEDIKLLNILNTNRNTNYTYNYGVVNLVPKNYNGDYLIDILTKTGEHLTAKVPSLEYIPIKGVEEVQNEVLISFNLPDGISEKYFSVIAEGTCEGESKLIIEDFDGSLWINGEISVSLRGDFQKWTDLKIKLLHISSDYYKFKESTDNAYSANIDPFTVPTEMVSNIEGGVGIFTYYTVDSLVIR